MTTTGRRTRRRCLLTGSAIAALSAGCLDVSTSDDGSTVADAGNDSAETESGADATETDDGADATEPIHAGYETTSVRVSTPSGEEQGVVTAAIADTADLRNLGLSDTPTLPEDRGMLFVFDSEDSRTFVMRDMDFGIDIVYADATGEITEIHHARAPGDDESGATQRYPGRGQYVLEVVYAWTAERGVDAGDFLEFDL